MVRLGAAVFAAGMAVLGPAWLGLMALVGVEIAYALRGGWQPAVPMLLLATSSGLLIAVTPHTAGQIFYAAGYAAAAFWLFGASQVSRLWGLAAANQFLALTAIFVLVSIVHMQTILALVMVWGASYVTADYVLAREGDSARSLLALTWALVVAELTWVLGIWLIQYVLIGGMLIIPLPAVVITGFGYSFAGIYFSHLNGKLSRGRLLEYLSIGGAFLLLIILGTKWSGG